MSFAPQHRPIIVASNRGPAQFHRRADGRFIPRAASGGLATALVSVAAQADLTWVAVAGSEQERAAFADREYRTVRLDGVQVDMRGVPIPDRTYRQFYDTISNNILWFTQHYLLQPDQYPSFDTRDFRAWDDGYAVVNRAVADAIIAEVQALSPSEQRRAIVMVQDYHLYFVPGMLREALPEIALTHFVHIPWPTARYWQMLPQYIIERIFTSMLANDVVGFQTPLDASTFVSGVRFLFPEVTIERVPEGGSLITWNGRRVLVRDYPIGIDPPRARELATSKAGQRGFAGIAKYFDRKTILRVDRLEPTKNIVRGLQAFALMLEQHPEMARKVRFVMILVPSREGVTRYRRYARDVNKLVQQINDTYGEQIVVHISGNDQARALAAMRHFDVMLANSVIDGMHLGIKEGAVVNERNGVLVLSRNTGAFMELGPRSSIGISPTDLYETSEALYAALMMPAARRRMMMAMARRRVESHTVLHWLREQLRDVDIVANERLTGNPMVLHQPDESAELQPMKA